MVTVQGWANAQKQFDRLVHFECKPRTKENILLQFSGVITKTTRAPEGVGRAHDLVSVMLLANQVTFGKSLLSGSVSSPEQ